MKRLITLVLLASLLLSGCGTFHKSFAGSRQWEDYRWPWKAPITLTVDTRHLSGDWYRAAESSATRWEFETNGDFKFDFVTDEWAARHRADITMTSKDYGKVNWVGLTSPTVDSYDRFTHVDIKFNDHWNKDNGYLSASCHELGHAMGLDHAKGIESCMVSHVEYDIPSGTDVELLHKIYR